VLPPATTVTDPDELMTAVLPLGTLIVGKVAIVADDPADPDPEAAPDPPVVVVVVVVPVDVVVVVVVGAEPDPDPAP